LFVRRFLHEQAPDFHPERTLPIIMSGPLGSLFGGPYDHCERTILDLRIERGFSLFHGGAG
jgi:hypothetical protein